MEQLQPVFEDLNSNKINHEAESSEKEQTLNNVIRFLSEHLMKPSEKITAETILKKELPLTVTDENKIRYFLAVCNGVDCIQLNFKTFAGDKIWAPITPWELDWEENKFKKHIYCIDDIVTAILNKKWCAKPAVRRPTWERITQYTTSYLIFGILLGIPLTGLFFSVSA